MFLSLIESGKSNLLKICLQQVPTENSFCLANLLCYTGWPIGSINQGGQSALLTRVANQLCYTGWLIGSINQGGQSALFDRVVNLLC